MSEFEERADQLTGEVIDASMADGVIFQKARSKLIGPGAKLLVGPRGTGKTHLMRYTYRQCLKRPAAPLALYASFSKYLSLEPLLKNSPDARQRFHSWVLAKLLLSCFDVIQDIGTVEIELSSINAVYDKVRLTELVTLLERGSGSDLYELLGQHLTVSHVLNAIEVLRQRTGRKRAVVFLDDAALSLADQYLIAFFEIYRLLKSDTVAPKASVYPGSTQYGPTFHASHEAEEVPLWLSVEDSDYLQIMGDISDRRMDAADIGSINPGVIELFKYVSFGIPRAYLRLLREYVEEKAGSSQQRINKIIERQVDQIGLEFDSIGIKLKQFSSVIRMGRRFFDQAVSAVSDARGNEASKKNIIFGLKQNEERSPLADRMIKFLIEVGMVYPLHAVSHGPNRKYDRYIPHLAFLQQAGLFREGRGASFSDVASYMRRPAARQPIRRDLSSLLKPDELAMLALDLPPCENCNATRISESQRYCHNCGKELVTASLFNECMKLPLEKVPGISAAMIKRIHQDTKLRTVGHVYSSQNASNDLQQASYVGKKRATEIVEKVAVQIEEFLS